LAEEEVVRAGLALISKEEALPLQRRYPHAYEGELRRHGRRFGVARAPVLIVRNVVFYMSKVDAPTPKLR